MWIVPDTFCHSGTKMGSGVQDVASTVGLGRQYLRLDFINSVVVIEMNILTSFPSYRSNVNYHIIGSSLTGIDHTVTGQAGVDCLNAPVVGTFKGKSILSPAMVFVPLIARPYCTS